MNSLVSLLVVAGLLAQGTPPAQVRVWKSGDIDKRGAELAKKLDAQKVASEVIAREGNRTFMVAHREGPGSRKCTTRKPTSWSSPAAR